jgi:hypothetical protein
MRLRRVGKPTGWGLGTRPGRRCLGTRAPDNSRMLPRFLPFQGDLRSELPRVPSLQHGDRWRRNAAFGRQRASGGTSS